MGLFGNRFKMDVLFHSSLTASYTQSIFAKFPKSFSLFLRHPETCVATHCAEVYREDSLLSLRRYPHCLHSTRLSTNPDSESMARLSSQQSGLGDARIELGPLGTEALPEKPKEFEADWPDDHHR